jgi:hypothetical protein
LIRHIVLVILLLGSILTSRALPQTSEQHEVEIVFTGIETTTLPKTGEAITVACFRLTNNTDWPVEYCEHCGAPNLFVQTPGKDGTWKLNIWDWCGMGKRKATLAPKETKYFYIDPKYYRTLYGGNLRVGLSVSTKTTRYDPDNWLANLVWSGPASLPNVENPDRLSERGYLTRKQDTVDKRPSNAK